MATGDATDITQRLRSWLPTSWFPTDAASGPVTTGVLVGMANAFAAIFQQLAYAQQQTRIATSTDGWVDLTSNDYFGIRLPRLQNESDAQFVARIRKELLRERATRHGLDQVLFDLTGNHPTIQENARPLDNGAYDVPIWGYDVAGAYSGDDLVYQVFITIARPLQSGIPNIPGYDDPQGAYDIPTLEYTDSSMSVGVQVTDADIFAAAESVRPDGVIYWINITGTPLPGYMNLGSFILGTSFLGVPTV